MDSMIPGKDYFPEVLVASTADPESDPTPLTGSNEVKVIFSATDGGDPITPALSVTCTDAGATKTVQGQSYQIYSGALAGSDTLTALTSFVGQTIYRRTVVGTHERESVPVIVKTR